MKKIYLGMVSVVCIVSFFQKTTAAEVMKEMLPDKVNLYKKSNIKYTTLPIDIDCEKLPKNYKGHDFEKIFWTLRVRVKSIKKSEYETSEQFSRRSQKEMDKPIIGTLGRNDYFAVSIRPKQTIYDADNEQMSVIIKTSAVMSVNRYLESNIDKLAILVTEHSESKGSYIGANAFGVKTKVNYFKDVSYELAVMNPEELGHRDSNTYYDDIKYNLKNIEVKEAKAIKDKIAVMLVYTIQEPYVTTGVSGKSPTISSPTAFYHDVFYVYVKVIETIVYNAATGQIYLKEKYYDKDSFGVERDKISF